MAKAYRVRNWKDYNRSLVNRGSLTFWFSEEVVKNWENKIRTERGRPNYYADIAIISALTLRQLFRLPLRATEGLLRSVMELMKFELRVPAYTTLSRRGKELKVDLGVGQVNQARHVLVDATGIQVLGEGEWKKLQHGERRHQLWRKLHIAMDAEEQMILSAVMTESVRLDGNYLRGLVKDIQGPIRQLTGDGAYDKRDYYRVAYERGAKAVFPPQHNVAVQRNKINRDSTLLARDKTIRYIQRGRDKEARLKQWKERNNYHRRSLVETMMYRMKTLFGDQRRSRRFENQQTDLLIRCYAMNRITKLGMPKTVVLEN